MAAGGASQSTAKVREASWWQILLGCSPRGMLRICSFWMLSRAPISSESSLAMTREPGKAVLLKLVT